ncbi:hypothetical protein [Ponticaulis sp.]|uniref:hypothetical protein n=1 Tax=Ponticaulis sp. TaxID=2020902 RepID=UPI000C5B6196|nr:hypothetical protein [Ponticaulis sp.]MBN04490.1 hypothetical protein [Ponticaulis sp.]|tara:strand:- start:1183 stop:1422 length:240 start_codon:yes stop_codon:yes gene_type:complete
MARSYAKCRRDFETLETFAELDDAVEIDSMRTWLMENPTKAAAADLYERCIGNWFYEHHGEFKNPTVNKIARDHGFENE